MTVRIAPSILASDFARLGAETRAVSEAGADYVHVDVMDGHFVPNISIGPGVVRAIRPYTDKVLDVHLMISPVDPFVEEFADAGADIITVHPEAGAHVHRTIQLVRSCGKKVGVSINPGTPVSVLEDILHEVDLVLVMSVNPGFGGQKFIPGATRKIAQLREMIDATGKAIDLEVDGGINFDTAPKAIEAGADVLVAGTATFKGGPDSYADNIRRLRGEA
jgi:ribulose-phosphate 3-epimerase